MDLPLFFTILAGAGFLHACIYGIHLLRHRTTFFAATLYITVIAGANFLFRVFTAMHRIMEWDLPQPETTNIALLLQVSLAAALMLIAGVGKLQVDANRAIRQG